MLADSHIHLFANGFNDSGNDEVTQYEEIVRKCAIDCAIVVGYEGQAWASGNNLYIASLTVDRPWLHPLAFVNPEDLTISHLDSLILSGFEGISLYILSDEDAEVISEIDEDVWRWLVEHHWIISVNSKGNLWRAWKGVLEKYEKLILLISHLGLPDVEPNQISHRSIQGQMQNIKSLCAYENVYLKLSGFYALEPSIPIHKYLTLNHYLQYIFANFSIEKLLWGSDFSPALAFVTFDQTYHHLLQWPFKSPLSVSRLLRDNLMDLLADCEEQRRSMN